MISNSSGEGVAIQVKTSKAARREFKRNTEKNRWEFDVGSKAGIISGGKLFYAFVDLKGGAGTPDVFIVPSSEVQGVFANISYPRNIYWIVDCMKDYWFERWDRITDLLKPPMALPNRFVDSGTEFITIIPLPSP